MNNVGCKPDANLAEARNADRWRMRIRYIGLIGTGSLGSKPVAHHGSIQNPILRVGTAAFRLRRPRIILTLPASKTGSYGVPIEIDF